MHAPDPATPIDETLSALDDLVRQGKVRYVGTSNYRAYELAKALGVSERLNLARFDCNQPRYNILYREIESEILPLCDAEGVGTIAYNPLAGGFLTGKYESTEDLQEGTRFTLGDAGPRYRARYWDEVQFDEVQRLKSYFSERGISLTHAAIAWCVEQPGITSAIVGASRAAQVVDSLAYQDIELSEDDLAFCDEPWYNLPRQKDPNLALR
jgi:aryl-alcohol dehydrogenase-like predicted oxidoreductase